MNETLKAANDIRKLAQTFQSISNLSPLLDRLGTLEQAEAHESVASNLRA